MLDHAAIDQIFGHQAPTVAQVKAYVAVRIAAREFAHILVNFCPDSPEKELAIQRLRDCVDAANAGIKLNPKALSSD